MARKLAIVGYTAANVGIYRDQIKSLFKDAIEVSCHLTVDLARAASIVDAPLESARPALGLGAAKADSGLVMPLRSIAVLESSDLVLFTSYDAMIQSLGQSITPRKLVYASRAVSREGFERLEALEGRAWLVDETQTMAEQMVATLLQAGLRRVCLLPVAVGSRIFGARDTVVILGEPGPRSEAAGRVVDIGNSLLDVSTVLDIGFRLGLGHLLNRQNIRESYLEIATTNIGLAAVLAMTNRFEGFLDILLQSVDSGIIAVDAEGRIVACNARARHLIGLGAGEVTGSLCRAVVPQIPFDAVLREKSPLRDRVLRGPGGELSYSMDPILHSGLLYGAVAVIGPYPEDEQKRQRVARLPERGHRARYTFADIVGAGEAIARRKDMARRMAQSASSVLITGETGTGKEMFAQAIHNSSPRRDFPFVAVNCGALPESLLESELFGYEEGAFTGARRGGKPGLFELAHRGTLFLDEIGEMPPSLQMRLLRVLEERQVMRLGGAGLRGIDIRVIAASNRNLERMVAEGGFREDLYYRLAVLPLPIPPLRDRTEDILPLVREFQRLLGVAFCFEPEVESFLLQREWRGNARELRNCIEYVANLGIPRVGLADLPEPLLVQGRQQTPRTEGSAERGLETADGTIEPDTVAVHGREGGRREPVSSELGSGVGAARNPGATGYFSGGDTRDGDAAQDASVPSGDAVAEAGSDTAGRLRDDRSLRAFLLSRIDAARQAGARLGRRGLTAEARRIGLYVSERSVREALLELEREGIVEILPGRGGTIPRNIPAKR